MLPRTHESRVMLAIFLALAAAMTSLTLIEPRPGQNVVALLTALVAVAVAALSCRGVAALSDALAVARRARARASR